MPAHSHIRSDAVSVCNRANNKQTSFEELAVSVAIRVWNGLQQSKTIDMQSYHFVHMLRVCRNFSQPHQVAQKHALAQQIFQEAVAIQKVNVHVLQELLMVASPKVVQEVLGTKEYSKDPLQLIRHIPPHWMEHADGKDKNRNPYEW